ncbi:MAG: glycosyltransferase [Lentisphaeria bacterium]|nr:glycosyltransferase [Lentisphaeria bacterium]
MNYAVVTICLNAEETLQRTIDSVLVQNPSPAEFLFIDGGSDDGTLAIIEKTRERLPDGTRLELVRQPPTPTGIAGIPNAWNLALERVTADLVFLLNADDWCEPTTAATVLQAFTDKPATDLLITPIRFATGPDDPAPGILSPRPFWLFPVLMPVMHPGCFVRRTVYERVGCFDERYRISADYDFVYRCRKAGMHFVHCNCPLVTMQKGGLANRSRALARDESLRIALAHSRVPLLSRLAHLARRILGR